MNNFQQLSKLIELFLQTHFCKLDLISLLLQIKSSTNRQLHPKEISDHTINVKLYIVECRFVPELLSFHMLPDWVKYQIADKNIQGLS